MKEFNINDFEITLSLIKDNERKLNSFKKAIETINTSIQNKMIRNVIYQDTKDTLNRISEEVWKKFINERYFWNQKYLSLPESLRESIYIMSLHDVISANKKIQKIKEKCELVDDYKKIAKEYLELSETLKEIKNYIVKGREKKETTEDTQTNPWKVSRTCPCCFRKIAVQNSKMAHHGFERPGIGYQTESCMGINYEPFEVSKKGTEDLIDKIKQRIEEVNKQLINIPNLTDLTVLVNDKNNYSIKIPKKVYNTDKYWKTYIESYKNNLESELSQLNYNLKFFVKKCKEWKQIETMEDINNEIKSKKELFLNKNIENENIEDNNTLKM